MTNKDKADLRYTLRYHSELSNRQIADEIGCHISTVRKWRRSIHPKETLATMRSPQL